MILAGDIGGTKTNLAFFEIQDDRLVAVIEAQFVSDEHTTFDELATRFLRQYPVRADIACFGIAGPCRHGRCHAMNLPWIIDARELCATMDIPSVILINDLEATAYAIPVLPESEFAVIHAGAANADGNAAVIAAGTGLGEAGLLWDGRRHHPFACEGGHSDFAPRNELEAGLFEFLQYKFGHVAWERVLSGPGLYNVYCYLASQRIAHPNLDILEVSQQFDPAAAISQAALEDRCPLCVAALNLFVSLYGSEAGNLALKMLATGGVYIGGGIAPKILTKTNCHEFAQAFVDKGRLRPVLEQIPIRVILTNKAALIGAAQCARIYNAA